MAQKKEIYKELIICKTKGAMFHSEMADYYSFLKCEKLKEKHNHEMCEDLKELREIKDHFMDTYDEMIIADYSETEPERVIPKEWEEYKQVKADKMRYIKEGIVTWHNWEVDTKEHITKWANELFDMKCYEDYKFVKKYLDASTLELAHIKDLHDYISKLNSWEDEGLKYKI